MRVIYYAQALVWHPRGTVLSLLLLACSIAGCNGTQQSAQPNQDELSPYWPKPNATWQEAQYASLQVAMPVISDAEYVNDDQLCMVCHEAYTQAHQHNIHREQSCEKCHGPASRHLQSRGKEPGSILSFKQLPPAERSELCLQCHEQNQCEPGARWRTSVHAHNGVSCTDCHTSHYNVPPGTPATTVAGIGGHDRAQLASLIQDDAPADLATLRADSNAMGAVTPQICYRCHSGMSQLEHIAHPHQALGPNSFTCNTCHDPHGQIREETRKDLCLQCHSGAPTMAWHSSSHNLQGVACTDCHNPHPDASVSRRVNISHTSIRRPPRLPMSVDEPNACYKCHPQIYAQNAMPSHHPIKEGKMVCSDCHDPHGQMEGNLKGATVNQVCYKCHADKQGPFTYEHPPVTENCAICHQPHGTVENNLLRQPATFLCLRCHAGHRTGPGFHNPRPGRTLLDDIGTHPNLQRAFYSDCTECHSQVHGSDVPSPHLPHAFVR